MSTTNEDIVRAWLLRHGWSYDALRHGLVSPSGQFVAVSDFEEQFTATQVRAMQEEHERKIAEHMAKIAPPPLRDTRKGMDPNDHIADALAYGASQFSPQFAPHQNTWSPYDKLKMRLGMAKSETFGLEHCHIVEGKMKVFVFLVQGDKAIVLDDDPALFPSDTLIGQYRLFKEAVS
jgi:hypothetical protein